MGRLIRALVLVLLLPAVVCGSDAVTIDGYYKNFFLMYDISDVSGVLFRSDAPMGSVSGRLRLNGTWWLSDGIHLRAAYDFAPRVQDRLLFIGMPVAATIDPFSYRVADLDSRLYPCPDDDVNSFAIFHNLDRAFMTLETERFDLYVGRQPIAFGSARVINPTDVIAPYSYEALDTEDRVGVDAIRARTPLGFMGEIDAGYVFGDDFEYEESAYFLRTKYYALQTDIAVMLMGFRENLMLGLDLARAVGGAGVWVEAAHVFAEGSDRRGKDYFRASLGFDYVFRNNSYFFAEYHFNQAGKDDANDYIANFTERAYTDGAVYLMGRHYLTPGITWEFTPLVLGSMEVLTNLSDQSVYIAPGVEYNFAENVYISGGAFIGFGNRPDSVDPSGSEFGTYPDIYYTSFRIYF